MGKTIHQSRTKFIANGSRRIKTPIRPTGIESADRRKALIDKFKEDDMQIMIATEAASEGISLQFCSMMISTTCRGIHNVLSNELGESQYGSAV